MPLIMQYFIVFKAFKALSYISRHLNKRNIDVHIAVTGAIQTLTLTCITTPLAEKSNRPECFVTSILWNARHF